MNTLEIRFFSKIGFLKPRCQKKYLKFFVGWASVFLPTIIGKALHKKNLAHPTFPRWLFKLSNIIMIPAHLVQKQEYVIYQTLLFVPQMNRQ